MTFYTDAFMYGSNPSPKGGGFTVCDEDGCLLHQEEFLRYLTCNEAELLGIHYAVTNAKPNDTVITDSQIAMGWAKKGKSKARPDLNQLCKEIQELLKYRFIKLVWQPREMNKAGIYNEEHTSAMTLL